MLFTPDTVMLQVYVPQLIYRFLDRYLATAWRTCFRRIVFRPTSLELGFIIRFDHVYFITILNCSDVVTFSIDVIASADVITLVTFSAVVV